MSILSQGQRAAARRYLHVHCLVELAAIPEVQGHVITVDVMHGDVQLLGQHSQGVAAYACDDAATKVSCCCSITILSRSTTTSGSNQSSVMVSAEGWAFL